LTLLSSNVGNFDTAMISVFFNAIVAGPIVDQINTALAAGFPIKPKGEYACLCHLVDPD